mmetsp:Transcript_142947/g.249413  ORF Transcript_142947/g.249413 Transcript_142947/m.249413 type:complete len:92 (+) Transcript_142947:438-713(+)
MPGPIRSIVCLPAHCAHSCIQGGHKVSGGFDVCHGPTSHTKLMKRWTGNRRAKQNGPSSSKTNRGHCYRPPACISEGPKAVPVPTPRDTPP